MVMIIKSFRNFSTLDEGYSSKDDYGIEVEPSKSAKYKIFEIIKNWEGEAAIARNRSTKKLYFFYYAGIEKEEFYDYAWLPGYWEHDEDGKSKVPLTEYFEYDNDVIEEYLNDNVNYLEYGEGLEDYEIGEANLILIDEKLKEEIEKTFGKFE